MSGEQFEDMHIWRFSPAYIWKGGMSDFFVLKKRRKEGWEEGRTEGQEEIWSCHSHWWHIPWLPCSEQSPSCCLYMAINPNFTYPSYLQSTPYSWFSVLNHGSILEVLELLGDLCGSPLSSSVSPVPSPSHQSHLCSPLNFQQPLSQVELTSLNYKRS